ncbi:hypothetical protein CkaCkLH20_04530 [Colletotrichum karsti]|uniref:Uncharacterized protein n=1 Tax=Colletotrichum karsti TaxID=1095194 RepID=A0A9P6I811_9PEZI|nr:uncharacterized protein CkaCkLH20_04530 [Colletotrichum karsti]KAF9877954.1 hypothetical protein CkaCkLH20_04530 [Colletotrichum karsti]
MTDATTNNPPKLVTRTSWILQWAFSSESPSIRFFKGCAIGMVLGLFVSTLCLCYVPCFHYQYSRSGDGVWEFWMPGTGWRFTLHPPGAYVRWVRCWVRRRLRLFFMGREERTLRDEEAGGIELRDQGRREEQTLPEPTLPQFSGSYMFSAAGASNPDAQQGYGNHERQQRVRDEFRMERENIQRAVAEERRRSEIQQADAAALAQDEQSATTTPQQDVTTPQQQQPHAPESVQTTAPQQLENSPADQTSNNTARQTAPAPAAPSVMGPYQRYNPLDPMRPINLTNDDIERERLQKDRRWWRSMWTFMD